MTKKLYERSIHQNSQINRVKHVLGRLVCVTLVIMFTSSCVASNSAKFSSVYVFGDSLSDSGALGVVADGQHCQMPPNADCRSSNGPVWAELVAEELGLAADTAYSGGTNWAVGGHRSDDIVNSQVPNYLKSANGLADDTGLYIVWGGGNDNFQFHKDGTYDPITSAENILNSIQALADAGAKTFLVPNVPINDDWTATFNETLAKGIAEFNDSIDVIEFDALTIFSDVQNNPEAYGFINSTDPCFDGVTVCENPDLYSSWDSIHPSAAGHKVLANAVLDLMGVSRSNSTM